MELVIVNLPFTLFSESTLYKYSSSRKTPQRLVELTTTSSSTIACTHRVIMMYFFDFTFYRESARARDALWKSGASDRKSIAQSPLNCARLCAFVTALV